MTPFSLFTGLHNHANLGNGNFRTILLNGAAWITKLEIPKDGVPSKPLGKEELEKLIDEGKQAIEEKKRCRSCTVLRA